MVNWTPKPAQIGPERPVAKTAQGSNPDFPRRPARGAKWRTDQPYDLQAGWRGRAANGAVHKVLVAAEPPGDDPFAN
jgi:hypothetical protein